MGQDDREATNKETIRRGWLYYWANDPRVETKTKTVMRVPCLVFSRVVGYVTPVQNWNKGKLKEWEDRVPYNVPELKEAAHD